MPQVRVYLACSLDGFIAGPENDVSWLEGPHPGLPHRDPDALTFDAFMAEVGCLLMGRTTHDVVASFGTWPYGETPTLVATRRPLDPAAETVWAVSGTIDEVIAAAVRTAGARDVYLDGGDLIRQALEADLVDEMILTYVPILLARGTPLFGGLMTRRSLEFESHRSFGEGMFQVRARRRST
ncbi:MAG: dihydrofolate reductase family protein [Myxococcota bacterium]